jgi:hypothetical protein
VTALGLGAPYAILEPEHLTFINLRLLGLAAILAAAAIPRRWFDRAGARYALVALVLGLQANFFVRTVLFDREIEPALTVLSRLQPQQRLLPLVYHQHSDYFGPLFKMPVFMPSYYTVLGDGIDLQFWARIERHLPIGYHPGREPAHPHIAVPESFAPEHLQAVQYVLVAAPDDGDGGMRVAAYRSTMALLPNHLVNAGCLGRWCLLRAPDLPAP